MESISGGPSPEVAQLDEDLRLHKRWLDKKSISSKAYGELVETTLHTLVHSQVTVDRKMTVLETWREDDLISEAQQQEAGDLVAASRKRHTQWLRVSFFFCPI